MTDYVPKTENTKASETRDLCAYMGMGLATWQRVEDCHYQLFEKLLNGPSPTVCSILYFSPPTFESRRVLVDRIAQVLIADKEIKKEWEKLNKDLSTEAAKRGKLAHYGLDYEIVYNTPQPSLDFKMGAPRLAPSRYNQTAELLGNKTAKEPLTIRKIRDFIVSFMEIEDRLEAFLKALKPAKQQAMGFSQALAPFLSSQGEHPPIPPNSSRPDKPPSDQ
jgi:hypothetical protein